MKASVVARASFVVGLFLLALALAYGCDDQFVWENLWSFYHLRSLPLVLVALAGGALALICVPRVNAKIVFALRWLLLATRRYVHGDRWRSWGLYVGLLGVYACALWIWRSTNYMLGDTAEGICKTIPWRTHVYGVYIESSEPLATIVRTLSYRALFNTFGIPFLNAYAVVSCTAGVIYLVTAKSFTDKLGGQAVDRTLVLLMWLTVGATQLFFGYVEHYSWVTVSILAYAYLAWCCLCRSKSVWWPAMAFGLAVAFHKVTLFLTPSLAVLWWVVGRRRQGEGLVQVGLKLAVGAPLPLLLVWFLAKLLGQPFALIGGSESWPMVFQVPPGSFVWQYPFLSGQHLIAVANVVFLAATSAVLAWFSLRPRRAAGEAERAYLWFLGVLIACTLMFILVWNPTLGAYKDWDLFSIPAVPLAVGAAFCLVKLHTRAVRRYLAVVCISIGLVHTGSWVHSNAAYDVKPETAKMYVYYAAHCVKADKLSAARECLVTALRHDPDLQEAKQLLEELSR